MHEPTDIESETVDAVLRSDPELHEQLHPLLAGEFGWEARELVLACLAARIEQGAAADAGLIPALADALHAARGDFDA